MTLAQAFDSALQHHHAGRLAEAEEIYRRILAAQPKHPDALHLLGFLAHQVGRHESAADLIRQAIAVNPTDLIYHINLGNALVAQGHLDEAMATYHGALRLKPDFAVAYHNLGVALKAQGRLDEAVAAYRRALEIDPGYVDAHNNLGALLQERGEFAEAVALYRRALHLSPGHPEVHINLGMAFAKQGQLNEAIASYRRALAMESGGPRTPLDPGLAPTGQASMDETVAARRVAVEGKPDFAIAYNNLGAALREKGQFDEAAAACRQALQIKPDYADAWWNLALALHRLGHFEEAVGAYRQLLQLRPDAAEAQLNLGDALREQGQMDEAMAAYRQALELRPDSAEAWNNMGAVLARQGQIGQAVEAYRQALELKPDQAWVQSNLIYALHFHPAHDTGTIAEEQGRWSRQFAEPLRQLHAPHANDRNPERRLRVGYVSPDFRGHVIRHFLTPLLESHHRTHIEIYCYASVRRPDKITERLKEAADVWRDALAWPDEVLARRIREDQIDILVDLTLHMADNRLLVFARKPAPVQISWLGYPASTGLREMDYRLTDPWMEPEKGAPWSESVETPIRLPASWCCFDPIDEYPEPGELPALRAGYITFGSLNNFSKVNEGVLALWAAILRAVEGSRLLLHCPAGETQSRVRQWFGARGIAAHRLELVSWTAARATFLRLFEQIDVALDPFPYNGGTTTCEALWMGLPVVTLAGETAISRAGLSLLSNIGHPEWVARSAAEYVDIAQSLSRDPARLAQLRATLRKRMKASVLMDAPRFARDVEAAYRSMWKRWCAAGIETRLAPR